MTRLIITDIDGTLVPEGSPYLNPEYYTAMEKLTQRGVTVAVASGRHAASIRKLFAPVAEQLWILSQNGSVLERHERYIVPHPLPFAWVRELWEELSRYPDADFLINTVKGSFAPHENTEMYRLLKEKYRYDLHAVYDWSAMEQAIPTMMSIYCPDEPERFCRECLSPKWKDRLQILSAGRKWVDLVMPGNGKDAALKTLCEELRIDPGEVVAFGDNMNDLAMLKLAGTGVTVETAKSEVKAAAQKIVPAPQQNGVLLELKRILEIISK